jgi:GDP/UDP-N,N'-diacetylbacillosamine 2-epimerase (hydrolysing)
MKCCYLKHSNRIIYLTGTRAEYGLMKPTLRELSKKYQIDLIVTGTHLVKRYGYTINNIKMDDFSIISKIKLPRHENNLSYMANSVGYLIPKISHILKKFKPNFVLVEGDRGEQLAMAIAAAYMGIPIAHTSGGYLSGTVDDYVRNAISKLSHIHLAPTKKSAERLYKMNEEKQRIHVVGPPINLNYKKIDIYKKLNLFNDKELIVVLQHPVSYEKEYASKQMKETIDAIKKLKKQTVIIYPNSDTGSDFIISEIEKIRKFKFIKIFKSLENDIFMNLLENASALVGNSSAGIVEAPFFKLPVLNIGSRQKNRERGNNVIDSNHNSEEIFKKINYILQNKFRQKIRKNPYYIKKPTEKNILEVFLKLSDKNNLLVKNPVY